MAYDASKETRKVIKVIDMNAFGDKVQVSEVGYEGKESTAVDIRKMYTHRESGEILPTPKGIRFNKEILPEVIAALNGMVE